VGGWHASFVPKSEVTFDEPRQPAQGASRTREAELVGGGKRHDPF